MFGTCYYPEHWPSSEWANDAANMAALGLDCVRIGEFSWSRLEPEAHVYEFAWLDEAIDVLGAAGLGVVIGTPTATPPKWLVDSTPDILPVDPDTGRRRGFGSRRHYDFSSAAYLEHSLRITAALAERYGEHRHVIGWQTDNELACHDTTVSVSAAAVAAFRDWCRRRYGDIASLNQNWGNVFWSMEYPDFDAIEAPFGAVTEANPAHRLAFHRFSSDQVVRFHAELVRAIQKHVKDQFITHNFIPMSDTNADDFALAEALDFVSYDNYPLGRTDVHLGELPPDTFRRYMRTGHPDFASYTLDQVRGLKRQPFWIMEQQPGPVNWANNNPIPAAGMVRLWTLEAFAHGASCVAYFRWRQVPFAQEQMHAGLRRPDDRESGTWDEVRRVIREVADLGIAEEPVSASVAIVTHVEADWVTAIERQSSAYNFETVQFAWYRALRSLGLDVDFVAPDSDLSGYRVIALPCMPIVGTALADSLTGASAAIVVGPRSGAKTADFSIPAGLAPGRLGDLLGVQVLDVETTRPDLPEPVTWDGREYESHTWRERLAVDDAVVVAEFADGHPAITRRGNALYVATLGCDDLMRDLFAALCDEQGIETVRLNDDLRIARRGGLCFAFNFADEPQSLGPGERDFVLGSTDVGPRDVSVWRE